MRKVKILLLPSFLVIIEQKNTKNKPNKQWDKKKKIAVIRMYFYFSLNKNKRYYSFCTESGTIKPFSEQYNQYRHCGTNTSEKQFSADMQSLLSTNVPLAMDTTLSSKTVHVIEQILFTPGELPTVRSVQYSSNRCGTQHFRNIQVDYVCRNSGCTRATFLNSFMCVCGHCISHQLMGTICTPASLWATTTPSSFSAVVNR